MLHTALVLEQRSHVDEHHLDVARCILQRVHIRVIHARLRVRDENLDWHPAISGSNLHSEYAFMNERAYGKNERANLTIAL
jgi:hypothetical protein